MRQVVLSLLATTVTLTGAILFVGTHIINVLYWKLPYKEVLGENHLVINTSTFTVSNVWLGVIILGIILWCIVLICEFCNKSKHSQDKKEF